MEKSLQNIDLPFTRDNCVDGSKIPTIKLRLLIYAKMLVQKQSDATLLKRLEVNNQRSLWRDLFVWAARNVSVHLQPYTLCNSIKSCNDDGNNNKQARTQENKKSQMNFMKCMVLKRII